MKQTIVIVLLAALSGCATTPQAHRTPEDCSAYKDEVVQSRCEWINQHQSESHPVEEFIGGVALINLLFVPF